jgi:hypothetical protein
LLEPPKARETHSQTRGKENVPSHANVSPSRANVPPVGANEKLKVIEEEMTPDVVWKELQKLYLTLLLSSRFILLE